MNQFTNSANVIAQPVPLFASSWVALFFILRQRLGGQGGESRQVAEDDNTQMAHPRH